MKALLEKYKEVRSYTKELCAPLEIEDFVVQPEVFVSPPKWHLAHTTWFFETFILAKYIKNYKSFDQQFSYLFNSYYQTVGKPFVRANRGNLTRPAVKEIFKYLEYVDDHMEELLINASDEELLDLIILGLNHEQQHQELLLMDIKYILGNNPLLPSYDKSFNEDKGFEYHEEYKLIKEGIYEIGYHGNDFSYDNEKGHHKVFLNSFEINYSQITNGMYLEFLIDKGYDRVDLWHAESWDWIQYNKIRNPLYWYNKDGQWYEYKLSGLETLKPQGPLKHISFYEAFAFSEWMGMRLPTEFEWEAAASLLQKGTCWDWTQSAYLPYPGYLKPKGAIGEYNGKFMVNQKVLRGSSVATPEDHIRLTYRNFFHPDMRWQFAGARLVK